MSFNSQVSEHLRSLISEYKQHYNRADGLGSKLEPDDDGCSCDCSACDDCEYKYHDELDPIEYARIEQELEAVRSEMRLVKLSIIRLLSYAKWQKIEGLPLVTFNRDYLKIEEVKS